jgi:hypothetical protein
MKFFSNLFLLAIAASMLQAQDIESKLSGNTTTQGFTVKNNSGNPLFTIRGDGATAIGTPTPEFKLTLDNDGGIIAKGTLNSGTALATSGAGVRLIWYPKKAAMRAGRAIGSEWDEANIGPSSFAVGFDTKASGNSSTAIGSDCIASGDGSIAAGTMNTAGDYSSVALGFQCTADAMCAIALGYLNSAHGKASTAMGIGTVANALSCTAIGSYNVGGGSATTWVATDPLFEIGNSQNFNSHSNAMTVLKNGNVGIGTTTPSALLEVTGLVKIAGTDGLVSTGSFGSGAAPASGAGTRMMWYPAKAAFRGGYINGTQWDAANVGNYSSALGFCVQASGSSSIALGSNSAATGAWTPIAIGDFVTASADNAVAIGSHVSASTSGSCLIGDNSTNTMLSPAAEKMFMARFAGGYALLTNSAASLGVSLAANATSWAVISDSTRKCNMHAVEADRVLSGFAALRLGSWNYKEAPNLCDRHYGPMAQEWFAAFGHDGVGTIGNDTTLASADVDGVLCIAVQALEKRTAELKDANARIGALEQMTAKMQEEKDNMITSLRKELSELRSLKSEMAVMKAILLERSSPADTQQAQLHITK